MINVEFLKGQIAKKSTSDLKKCISLYTDLKSRSVRDEVYTSLLEQELDRRQSAGENILETTHHLWQHHGK